MEHEPSCPWVLADCEYKATHHYCPHPEHACTCPVINPMVKDDDIPLDVRRELMACAVGNGRISYGWLCDVFRKGRRVGERPAPTVPARLLELEAENKTLRWVLTLDEFEAREQIWDLLRNGMLELTPERKLVAGVRSTPERP